MLLLVLNLVKLSMQYIASKDKTNTVAPDATIMGASVLTLAGSTSAFPVFSLTVGSVGRMLNEKIETKTVVNRLIPVENFGYFLLFFALNQIVTAMLATVRMKKGTTIQTYKQK